MGDMSIPARSTGRWAPLANLSHASRAIEGAMHRSTNLPGIVCVHARYGSGKSMTLSYCQNEHEGFLLECKSHFSKKSFAQEVLKEMDIKPGRTVSDMMAQIGEELDKSGRPLLLDDVHRITSSAVLGLILDIHQSARTTIVLAGNEGFPATLRRYDEQLWSRVLRWVKIGVIGAEDARRLARYYVVTRDGDTIKVADDLLNYFREKTRGNARLLCINLDHVREHCQKHGLKDIDLDAWGKRGIYTGEAPEDGE